MIHETEDFSEAISFNPEVAYKHIIALYLVLFIFTSCNTGQLKSKSSTSPKKSEIESTKPNTWISLKEKETIDGYTKLNGHIYGGEIACDVKPLDGIDVPTFQVLAGTKYAKDKNHVYYPIRISCIDYTDCGVCYYADIVIADADPATFVYLDKEYAIDNDHVYFRGEPIKGAESKTFKVIDGPEYFFFAKDRNKVYYFNHYFSEADAESFYFDREHPLNVISAYEHVYIVADKHNHWEFRPPGQFKKIDIDGDHKL